MAVSHRLIADRGGEVETTHSEALCLSLFSCHWAGRNADDCAGN